MNRTAWAAINGRFSGKRVAWPTLAVLACDMAGAGASLALACHGGWCWLPAVALLLLTLLHFYLIHHEAVHGVVLPSARQNRWLGHLLGFILLYPFRPRQQSHMAHHRWTGHPEGDPTNRRLAIYMAALDSSGHARLNRMWNHWIPFFAWRETQALWRQACFGDGSGVRMALARHTGAWLQLLAYAALLAAVSMHGSLLTVLCWYVPAYYGLLVMQEIINLPHHTETPLIDNSRPYEFWRQDEVTHSCRDLPIWSSCVLLNFNLHTAHHLFPGAAWYQLPAAHRLMEAASGAVAAVDNELHWNWQHRPQPFMSLYAAYLGSVATRRPALPLAEGEVSV
jgi:omega-6 fatty acid desaturase (delta-12 desaturase)